MAILYTVTLNKVIKKSSQLFRVHQNQKDQDWPE